MSGKRKEQAAEISLRTKVYLTDAEGTPFFGIGVMWLLSNIREYGSIRKAAGAMELSYAKAHRMIDDAERGLGFRLLARKRGGDSRKGARLTREGERILQEYTELQERIKEGARQAFDDFLPLVRELAERAEGAEHAGGAGAS
jgi:molybdate transport system regulatory protein